MKNVFLFVALLLSVSFSFANNNVEPDVLTVEIEETVVLTNLFNSADFNYSVNVKETLGTCTYSITNISIGLDGKIKTKEKTFVRSASSQSDCNAIAEAHAALINSGAIPF